MIKKAMIKKLMVSAIACIAMACVFVSPANTTVNAADEDFVMAGASLRYNTETSVEEDDGTGLKFSLNAKPNYIASAKEIGMLIIPSNQLSGEELTVYTENAVMNPKDADDWTTNASNETYQVTHTYLWDIPVEASEWEVTARGYALVGNEYVYTPAITRSMRSVAVSASMSSENTEEGGAMRGTLEKYMDEGNLTYFGTDYGIQYGGYQITNQDGRSMRTEEVMGPTGETEKVGRFTLATSRSAMLWVKTPAVKDITDYKYLTFWVKMGTGTEDKVNYTVNLGVVGSGYVNGTTNEWKRFVYTKNAAGNNFVGEGGTNIFKSMSATMSWMNGIQMTFDLTDKVVSAAEVLLTDFYGSNTLPQIKATLNSTAETSDTVNVADMYEIIDATNATVKTYVAVGDGEKTEITDTSYTFTNKGVYAFTFELYENGYASPSQVVTQNVTVAAKQTVIVDFNDPNAIETYQLTANWGSIATYPLAYPVTGTQGSVQVTANKVSGAYRGGINFNNPACTDLSQFKYVYLDIYSNNPIFLGNYPIDPVIEIAGEGAWRRLVFERQADGSFIVMGTETTMFTATQAQDITKAGYKGAPLLLYHKHTTSAGTYWLGGFYGCDELPELPSGMAYASVTAL